MSFNIDHPILTSIIILVAVIGTTFLLRSRFAKRISSERSGVPDASATGTPTAGDAPPQPAKVATVQTAKPDRFAAPPIKRKGWLLFDVVIILIVGIAWFSFEGPILKMLMPLLVSSATGRQANHVGSMPHSPSGAPLLVCTATKPQPVTVTKEGVTRIDTPFPCTLHLDDITAPADVFELSCWDKDDEYHDTWDAACETAKAAGLRLRDDQDEDSRQVPISFI